MKVVLVLLVGVTIWGKTYSQSREILAVDSMTAYLSAFGVENDSFPSINGKINFRKRTNYFEKSYYNPAIKGSNYRLLTKAMDRVLTLILDSSFRNLKREYKVYATDQPTSTLTIYTNKGTIVIVDYGLEGEYPLKEIYRIIYRY
jgi:hypothetical protein